MEAVLPILPLVSTWFDIFYGLELYWCGIALMWISVKLQPWSSTLLNQDMISVMSFEAQADTNWWERKNQKLIFEKKEKNQINGRMKQKSIHINLILVVFDCVNSSERHYQVKHTVFSLFSMAIPFNAYCIVIYSAYSVHSSLYT